MTFLAACGGDDSPAAQPTTTQSTSAESADSTDVPPGPGPSTDAPVTDPTAPGAIDGVEYDPDAVLRIGWHLNPTSLDPFREPTEENLALTALAYDRLTNRLPTGEIVPMLAESWGYNDDATELVMHLRDGVVFHDGTPFNAEAVRANMDRARTIEGSSAASVLALVESVEVIDDLTVRFVSSSPNAVLTTSLADRAGSMISPAAFDEDLSLVESGAGPFELVEHRPGEVTIYERFDDYWDPEVAKVARVEVYYMGDQTTRANALRSGQIDMSHFNPAGLGDVEGQPGLDIEMRPTSQYYQMSIDWQYEPFGDVRVRQAIMHALDRDGICQAILQGLCETYAQVVPESSIAFNPEIPNDHYAYDPDKARQLLADAGYADGFEFDLVILAGLPPYGEMSEVIQAQLGEVGIRVNLVPLEPALVAEATITNREFPSYLAARLSRDPSLAIENYWLPTSPINFSGVTTERLQELYLASISTSDPDARRAILQDAMQEITDQVLDVVIAFPQYLFVHTDRVLGFQVPDSQAFIIRGVGIAK
ncbi:MAG TPA: ABC transporter substrate-binding protein [Ilumatobacter sp.]|nr:ABC transporter substrate-binding protein [Ilumatobacter sp.]